MGRLVPFVPRAWALPLIVAAIVVPIVAAFAAGPQFGLALGAVAAGTLIVLAGRMEYDEPIEVAPRRDSRYRLLIVAATALERPGAIEEVAAIAAEGARVARATGEAEILVVAPARQTRMARWASDVGEARGDAQRLLALSVAALASAGFEARGSVADPDPVLAVQDELQSFAAHEVVVLRGPGVGSEEVGEIRRRLDRPVRTIDAA